METAHGGKVTWHDEGLPRATKRALQYLKEQKWLKRSPWYLAGGTALALHLAHRSSLDLDFFTPEKEFSAAALLKHFNKRFWVADVVREGTIYGRLLEAKVSFIAYPFFRYRRPGHWYGNVRILDPADIAVMKIVAISQRGRKRDFVDLYWYAKNREPLLNVLRRLADQYPTVAHDYHHILKSLAYFADAEGDPMPKLFFRVTWREIKKFFEREVTRLAREFIGL